MYLLDIDVVSELRKPKPHGAVLAWLQGVDDKDLFLSAVTIGEIQAGIEITREQDIAKASQQGGVGCRPHDSAMCPGLMHKTSDALMEDAVIAATAKVHQWVVVTRNGADFKYFGVDVLNQFG
ncbi:MAG: type II toxin-antitoxin system VapC family toxin [Betaproteobacteria bacterium]|nr:type II toxin-antitoxin system VapC family toxin [Betaproteobacteria bacterium]